MKRNMGICLIFALLVGGATTLGAQQSADGATPPPKVLVLMREMIKPGKAGVPHQRTEGAFVQAMTAAKWPTHYIGVDSMSGPTRSLFLVGYDSFAAWEKDNLATQKNATLSAALDRAAVADGELLSGYESSTLVYREDLSLRANVNIAQMRYFEILRFQIRPGHEKDWEALVKLYTDGYGKASSVAHWATYESSYGVDNGGVYVVFNPMKSLAEVDSAFGDSKKFAEQLGEDGMRKLAELSAASIESSQTNLFVFNPKESYAADAWVKADPGFWKPKAATPVAKPAATPAQ